MRRTRMEIRLDILKLCCIPRRVTQIVYQCNLNFKIYKTHLGYLIERGWIKRINNLYKTTDEGEGILDYVSPAISLLAEYPV